MAILELNVNGETYRVDVDGATPLLYVLIDELGLRGPKFGCGLGQCGACTVIAGGETIRSCITPVERVATSRIVSLEGLGTRENPHPVQTAFIEAQAMQCGFCMNGVILSAWALLERNPGATDEELRQALSGVLCRCGAHTRIMAAVGRYRAESGA